MINFTPHWDVHECEERGARNNDYTIIIYIVVKEPQDGWPNMGQFLTNTTRWGSHGWFINICPFCGKDLRFKGEKK